MNGEKTKTGLILCRCGNNVADFVDLEAIASWAGERADIDFIESHDLLCSPAGKQFTEEKMKEHNADKVVIAACSPKMHEKTFREVGEKAGMNMAGVHMANIREQCGWVTKDRDGATAKAKALISASIKRSALHEDLEQKSMECLTGIVVIGGGIAGIEAALTAANAGRNVTIIEREVSLGGNLIKTEEVAPNMECSPCLLAPRLAAVKDNPNIEVVTNAEVTDVLGFFGNFTVKAEQKPRFVNDTCIGCEACFEACPVSAKSDFHLGLGERKAVYIAFPGSVPAAAKIDREHCLHFSDGSCKDACAQACPFQSIDFDDQERTLEIKAGAVILATGHEALTPAGMGNLGYGSIDNVYTLAEFERIGSSNGPFNGTIQRRDGKPPESVAVIHCAGSLTEQGLSYCSGVCCGTAAKVGEMLRKQVDGAKVYNIHDRLVFDGPEAHAFLRKQIEEGTQFLKTDTISSVSVSNGDGKITVSADGVKPIAVDMVVLSTGMVPARGSQNLSKKLNVDLDTYGFFKPDHPILHATGASLDGIYTAGSCASPCNASTSITRARAAAGDALSKLVPGKKIELEMMVSVVDEEICAGCKLCIAVCPYKAIAFDRDKSISVVNEAICRGCGTCAATCPSGAAIAKHFTDKQIYAEIGGILHD